MAYGLPGILVSFAVALLVGCGGSDEPATPSSELTELERFRADVERICRPVDGEIGVSAPNELDRNVEKEMYIAALDELEELDPPSGLGDEWRDYTQVADREFINYYVLGQKLPKPRPAEEKLARVFGTSGCI